MASEWAGDGMGGYGQSENNAREKQVNNDKQFVEIKKNEKIVLLCELRQYSTAQMHGPSKRSGNY